MTKIKCTYPDCFKHFSSHKSMITHKTKDPDHSYCALCDVDCEDDMLLFIHQLGSPNHTCCPVCAFEFSTIQARDRHVEQEHRTAQDLRCAGCCAQFRVASGLMSHIENGDCPTIRPSDFHMQRAEKQLHKDAWAAETKVLSITGIPSQVEGSDLPAASDLLGSQDDMREPRSLATAQGGPISVASPQQFPPLPGNRAINVTDTSQSPTPNSGGPPLIDLTTVEQNMAAMRVSTTAWQRADAVEALKVADEDDKVRGWLDDVSVTGPPPSDQHSQVANMYDQRRSASQTSDSIAPGRSVHEHAPAVAGHQRIITMPAHSIVSTNAPLDTERFWDANQQAYICPGANCGRSFPTAMHFRQHMTTSAHVGGKIVCPSCLKRFATTTAWVSHCESASKRCDIRNSSNFNRIMREITGGVLGTQGFLDDGTVQYVAPKIEEWNETG